MKLNITVFSPKDLLRNYMQLGRSLSQPISGQCFLSVRPKNTKKVWLFDIFRDYIEIKLV